MLILSRKRGEQIMIGENIVLTVVEIRGDRVRIGLEAPREVPITRAELLPDPPKSRYGPKAEQGGAS